jgi:hypothetical protein
MSAKGTADIDIYLHLGLAPGALVGSCHASNLLAKSPVDGAEGDPELWSLRLVRTTCKLESALATPPDSGAFSSNRNHIAPRASVRSPAYLFGLAHPFPDKSSIAGAESPSAPGNSSFCLLR